MELDVPPTPKRVSGKKRATRSDATRLLQEWSKEGLVFDEEAFFTMYRFSGGRLRFVKTFDGESALTSLDISVPEGSALETWQVSREQAKCGLLKVNARGRSAQLCFRYRVSGKFVHATLTYINSSGGHGGMRSSYPSTTGHMV